MTRRSRLLPLLLTALTLPLSQAFFQGCATITQGPLQKVQFDSKPAGATLYVNGIKVGKTPHLVVFSRWQRPRARFELDGFEPSELRMEKETMRGVVEGNSMVGLAPIVVDVVTGSFYQMSAPNQPGVTSDPWYKNKSPYGGWGIAFVGVTLKPLPGARKIGQMQRKQ